MLSLSEAAPGDYDLQQAWKDCLKAFAETARVELQPDSILSAEDVIAQLKSKRDKDEAHNSEYRVVKDVLGRTLACIQVLGSIAASGASMVFGPANLAYSGISYLITAGQNYSNIFSSLEALFKQVSDVMERMVVYLKMKEVDRPLRKIVHELLQSVMMICALSIKVLHGNRILKFLKVFAFNEDDGVGAELQNLKALVDRESQMKTTLTYAIVKEGLSDANKAVSGVRSVVDKLADESKRREGESVDRKQLEKIKATLGVAKEAEQQSQLYTRLWSEHVNDTGQWLQDEISYKEWADRTTSFNKVIFLSADQGYGKSFLLTSAIHSLHKQYNRQIDSAARTMIGYYYLIPKDSRASHGMEGLFSVDNVLKTIALQFAHDPVYRKELVTLCEKWIEPETTEELFMRLIDPCYRSSEVFYIIIDGIDLADEKQLNGLSQLLAGVTTRFSSEQQSHVRILFSGRVSVINSLSTELAYPNIVIDVATKNRPDVERFIQDRLASMKLVQGESEQVKMLRREIFDILTTEAHGDFVNIDLLLKEISTKQWPAEVREVLAKAKAGTRRADTIAREIARLNDTLSVQEIRDLNTMLLWVLRVNRPLAVRELSAVLFLKNGETSLRPLHERIRDRYSSIFHLDEAYSSEGEAAYIVSLVSDSIHDYFAAQELNLPSQGDHGMILESEVKIVRRFLNSVCDQDLYAKFGFDEFFAQKIHSTTALIDVDLERASATLALGCLQTLCSTTEELKPLFMYALDNFALHLTDVDLSMTDPNVKILIGKYLISAFTEEDIISNWWRMDTIGIRSLWFYKDAYVDTVLHWFKDSAVIKTFSDTQKAWVKSLTSNTSPDVDVLENIVIFLCKKLFLANTWMIKETYTSVAAWTTKLAHRKNASIKLIKEDLDPEEVLLEDIMEFSKWAAGKLAVNADTDYQFTRCLARLLRVHLEVEEAIKYYEKAIAITDEPWYAQLGLANAYGDQEEYQAAIELGEKLRDRLKDGVPQVENPKAAMQHIRNLLAGWYREVKRFDEALKIFDENLAEATYKYFLYQQKVLVFFAMESYQRIFDLFQELSTQRDPDSGISRRSAFWHAMAFDDDFYIKVKTAADETEQVPLLISIMKDADKDTSNPSYVPHAVQMKKLWHIVLCSNVDEWAWEIARTEEEKNAVVLSWEQNARDSMELGVTNIRQLIGKRLAQIYLDRMRESSPDSEETQENIKKLSDLAFEDSVDQDDWTTSLNTGLLLARYQRICGNEEGAMKLTRGTMKVGLDLLSDEDPDNDWQGYSRLATALMYYGDDDNALAAWSLIGPEPDDDSDEENDKKSEDDSEDDTEEPDESSEDEGAEGLQTTKKTIIKEAKNPASVSGILDSEATNEEDDPDDDDDDDDADDDADDDEESKPEGPVSYGCDGICKPETEWTYANGQYVCKDCLDVMFDEKCHGLLKAGKLSKNICNPKHEFLYVPKWDPREAEARGKDHVRYRGESVAVADWLKQLRSHWGLEERVATSTKEATDRKDEEPVATSDHMSS